MTTRTQWVRNMADSHLNKSMLQRLSLMWPRKVSQEAAGVLSRQIVMGENSANYVFVDLDVEHQGDLLSDSRTAPMGITSLHFNDHMNARSLGPRL
jgi:hypothetical protein